jgi:hypothetical protein
MCSNRQYQRHSQYLRPPGPIAEKGYFRAPQGADWGGLEPHKPTALAPNAARDRNLAVAHLQTPSLAAWSDACRYKHVPVTKGPGPTTKKTFFFVFFKVPGDCPSPQLNAMPANPPAIKHTGHAIPEDGIAGLGQPGERLLPQQALRLSHNLAFIEKQQKCEDILRGHRKHTSYAQLPHARVLHAVEHLWDKTRAEMCTRAASAPHGPAQKPSCQRFQRGQKTAQPASINVSTWPNKLLHHVQHTWEA